MQPHDTTRDNPVKLCECGCGQPAPIAQRSNRTFGHIKGQPVHFIRGHHNKIRILRPAKDRFWAKVIKRGPDECWDWHGSHDVFGYGQLRITERGTKSRAVKAHRFSYELHHGQIPDGYDCLHKCDYPPCTNPVHLFLGTAKDNMQDAKRKGRTSPPPRNGVKGDRHGKALYSDSQVIAWRQEFASSGLKVAAFARWKHVRYTTMYMLLTGRTWKHL